MPLSSAKAISSVQPTKRINGMLDSGLGARVPNMWEGMGLCSSFVLSERDKIHPRWPKARSVSFCPPHPLSPLSLSLPPSFACSLWGNVALARTKGTLQGQGAKTRFLLATYGRFSVLEPGVSRVSGGEMRGGI